MHLVMEGALVHSAVGSGDSVVLQDLLQVWALVILLEALACGTVGESHVSSPVPEGLRGKVSPVPP